MPKYDRYHPEFEKKKEKNVLHPVWRGIGCILIVVIPLLSGYIANFLVNNKEQYHWVIIPEEIVLAKYNDPFILVKGIYFLILTLILFFIIGLITFIINRIIGPSRGPYDLND
jgi:uncharacterized membrane protein